MYRKEFMSLAVAEARIGIKYKHGGPFGAVIVKNGKVIALGHNCVLNEKDSTCHGEISVIRKAEKALNTYDLSGCELYTTAEPCPMCLGAILWANIEKVYYGCSAEDAEVIGFRDKKFEKMFGGYSKKLDSTLEQKDQEMCLEVFEEYEAMEGEVY